MSANPVKWFQQMWPFDQGRRAVLAEYAGLGGSKYLLADIALRGHVWSVAPRAAGDVFQDGVNEGRRQLANEIIRLANERPDRLWGFVAKKPAPRDGDD